MSETISHQTFDEERALYHLVDATVSDCTFAGPADGESALKQCRDINVELCRFSLRYPLWHTTDFTLSDSSMDEGTRAALWYAQDGTISHCRLHGVKALRECGNIIMKDCDVVSSEFGWRCHDLTFNNDTITSEYFLFESKYTTIDNLRLTGKYSFQYCENMFVRNSVLNTKDAFWHAKDVTVLDSEINGEYLGWYSENLHLVRCHITGTQPLCYCKNLILEDCTMDNADLAFEYSDVTADIKGRVISIKNPKSGRIEVDEVGEIIRDDDVMESKGKIVVRN